MHKVDRRLAEVSQKVWRAVEAADAADSVPEKPRECAATRRKQQPIK